MIDEKKKKNRNYRSQNQLVKKGFKALSRVGFAAWLKPKIGRKIVNLLHHFFFFLFLRVKKVNRYSDFFIFIILSRIKTCLSFGRHRRRGAIRAHNQLS